MILNGNHSQIHLLFMFLEIMMQTVTMNILHW